MILKSIKTILLTLAAIVAGTTATRADHLSDLVAAVAASMDSIRIANDVKALNTASGTRYQGKEETEYIEASLLDGIYRSMKHHTFQRMVLLYDDYDPLDFRDDSQRPTLGRSDFFRPVPGIMTSRFGWRPRFQRIHHGVDLALNIGDTVKAALYGTIERIGFDADGYGHFVIISHPDGMQTLYGHLHYALVGQGQPVFAGQPIAIGGNTGNSTGPHLHFETRIGGVAVDPTLIFDFYGTRASRYNNAPSTGSLTVKVPTYSHQSKSLKKESTYIVRFGDTPESVARQAGISVMRLCQLNMLRQGDPLTVGRMLKLK